MPADKTGEGAVHARRPGRRDSEERRQTGGRSRELEEKRKRGEISCAECRRLKIKCDKRIPCQSCQRRGCESLCPNDSLSTGEGTRFVVAATESLYRRISDQKKRIRALEDALAELQARHSTDPHPLLCDDLDDSPSKEPNTDPSTPVPDSPESVPELVDVFGTLSIDRYGASRFFGATGGAESLLLSDSDSASDEEYTRSNGALHPEDAQKIDFYSRSFPFTPNAPVADVRRLVERYLPPWQEACDLCELYLQGVGWCFQTVERPQLFRETLPSCYCRQINLQYQAGAHDLALLFAVFAIGASVDSRSQSRESEARHYYQISKAAMCLDSVLESPSLTTIQSLSLASIYTAMATEGEASMELSWSLMSLACSLSQTVGLHRDSERWGLPAEIVERRRCVFWSMFMAEQWHSLATGRPAIFTRAQIDCKFPLQHGLPASDSEHAAHWFYRFVFEIVAEIAEKTQTCKPPTYLTIMELDRKVREFRLPSLNTLPDGSVGESMHKMIAGHVRETMLLYIHRSFFALAIQESPNDPLKSDYAHSFLTSYHSSCIVLDSVRSQFQISSTIISRFWTGMTFAFSASVVLGTIVTRGPNSLFVSNAMAKLDQACDLFQSATNLSRRSAKMLPILLRLREKAHRVLAKGNSIPSHLQQAGASSEVKDEGDDELSIFSGRTRFHSKQSSGPSSREHTLPPDIPSTSSSSSYHPPVPPVGRPTIDSCDPRYGYDQYSQSCPSDGGPSYIDQSQIAHSSALPFAHEYHYPRSVVADYHPPSIPTVPPIPAFHEYYPMPSMGAQIPKPAQPLSRELADLGIASRTSHLDQRWNSYMQDSVGASML